MAGSFAATVEARVEADRASCFLYIVPIDLASIFTGYGPLPAVTGTRNQSGGWNAPEQTRTVLLSDGSTAQELLTAYQQPRYFSYTVSAFSGVLRLLVASANGEWWFETDQPATATLVKWRYAFNARSAWAAPLVWFITTLLWRGYMRKALRLAKAQLETAAAGQAEQ